MQYFLISESYRSMGRWDRESQQNPPQDTLLEEKPEKKYF